MSPAKTQAQKDAEKKAKSDAKAAADAAKAAAKADADAKAAAENVGAEGNTPEGENGAGEKTPTVPARKVASSSRADGPIKVTLPDGTFRIYSRGKDGAVYKTLAENYAEAHDGKIS